MNIGLGGQAIISGKNRGIGNYTICLYREMFKLDKENQFFLLNFSDVSLKDEYFPDVPNLQEYMAGTRMNRLFEFYRTHVDQYKEEVRKFLEENQIDVFFSTSPIERAFPPQYRSDFGNVPVVMTMHDIIPYFLMNEGKMLDTFTERLGYLKKLFITRRVECLVSISHNTKQDYLRELHGNKNRIVVTYESVDATFNKIDVDDAEQQRIREKYQLQERILMCVGGNGEHKNVERLIKAFAEVDESKRKNATLVIAGDIMPKIKKKRDKIITENKVENQVVIPGFIDDEEFLKLYNMSEWMVFPSMYEGFGLPVVEAWRCGIPVMTSNTSSLGEIGKGAAVLVNPASEEDMSSGLTKILTMSEKERHRYIKLGEKRAECFSASAIAQKVLKILYRVADSKKEMSFAKRMWLALCEKYDMCCCMILAARATIKNSRTTRKEK